MKKILFCLLFGCSCSYAETLYIYSGYPFLVGQQSATDLTNVVEVTTNNISYQFNTNDTTKVIWQFPAQIVNGTNCITVLYQYATNSSVFTYDTVMSLYNSTNGLIYYTNNSMLSTTNSAGYSVYSYTNTISTNYVNQRTNISYGTFKIQHSTNGSLDNVWFLGGKITFK